MITYNGYPMAASTVYLTLLYNVCYFEVCKEIWCSRVATTINIKVQYSSNTTSYSCKFIANDLKSLFKVHVAWRPFCLRVLTCKCNRQYHTDTPCPVPYALTDHL